MKRALGAVLGLVAVGAVALGVVYLRSPAATRMKPGMSVPELKLRILDGGNMGGLQNIGRTPVLLLFFDRRWPDTIRLLESADRLNRRYLWSGLTVTGICLEPDAEVARQFVAQKGLNFTVLHDPDGRVSGEAFGPMSAPQAYLIDARGQVVEVYARPEEWREDQVRERVRTLLPPPSPDPR